MSHVPLDAVTVRAGRSGAVGGMLVPVGRGVAMTHRSMPPVLADGLDPTLARLSGHACPSVRTAAARRRPRRGVGPGRGPRPAGLPAGRTARRRRRDHDAGAARRSPISGLVWPPVARGRDTYPMVVALGVGSLLLLLPSIGGVLNQLQALGLADPDAVAGGRLPVAARAGRHEPVRRASASPAGSMRGRPCDRAGCASGPSSRSRSRSWPARPSPARRSPTSSRCATGRRRPPARASARPMPEAELPACDGALSAGSSARLIAHLRGQIDGRGRSARWTCPACASAPTSAGWPTSPRTASWASTAPPASAAGPGRATPGRRLGDGRRRGRPRADARPAGRPDGPRPAVAIDRRGSRHRGHRRRPRPPLSGRRRRRHVPAALPAGPLAGRRRGPQPLARPARLLGLRRRPARPGRGHRSTARPARSSPEAIQGDHRGVPDRDRTRPRTWSSILRAP